MSRRDGRAELGERPATRRRPPPEGRGIGERFAGAFFGGIIGVALGFAIAVVHYFITQAAFRYDLVGATVLYCAAFTFIFGETLGDAMMGLFRIHQISDAVENVHTHALNDPDAQWVKPILSLVLFAVPLALVIYLVLHHSPA